MPARLPTCWRRRWRDNRPRGMLAERDLRKALRRVNSQPAHGYYSRFVEFRHLSAGSRASAGPKPLWSLGSKLYGGRFTPKGSFETVYLAEDPVTAMAEVSGVLYCSQAPMPRTPQPPWVLITVEGILLRVLDLTAPEVQAAVGTNSQELTGAWRQVQAAGRLAPTQILGRVCYLSGRFEAIRYPSSKNIAGVCLGVFTDQLRSPAMIRVLDPHGRLAQRLP
jgi:RES domain-containing protein